MTQKEFFLAILELEGIPEALKEHAQERLNVLNTPTKKQKKNNEFRQEIYEHLTTLDEPITAADLATHFEVAPQKISGLLRQLVEEDMVTKAVNDNKKTVYSAS